MGTSPLSLDGAGLEPANPIQGYLAHKKQPPPLGLPWGPRHIPTVGSSGGAVFNERGTPVKQVMGASPLSLDEGGGVVPDPANLGGSRYHPAP